MRALFVCCLSLAITPGSLANSPRQDSTDAVRIVDCSWWQKPIVPSTGRPPAKDVVAEATVALKGAVAKGISIGQGSNLALFLPMSAAVVDRPGVTQEGIQRLAEKLVRGTTLRRKGFIGPKDRPRCEVQRLSRRKRLSRRHELPCDARDRWLGDRQNRSRTSGREKERWPFHSPRHPRGPTQMTTASLEFSGSDLIGQGVRTATGTKRSSCRSRLAT